MSESNLGLLFIRINILKSQFNFLRCKKFKISYRSTNTFEFFFQLFFLILSFKFLYSLFTCFFIHSHQLYIYDFCFMYFLVKILLNTMTCNNKMETILTTSKESPKLTVFIIL